MMNPLLVQHLPAWEWCDASGVFLEFEDQEKAGKHGVVEIDEGSCQQDCPWQWKSNPHNGNCFFKMPAKGNPNGGNNSIFNPATSCKNSAACRGAPRKRGPG